MVAPVLIDAQGNQTEDILKTEALGIHPIPPQSTSADPLTTSFKDTNRFCFTAPNHGSYPIPLHRADIFFDVAHDAYAAGQHIRPNDPNKRGEWNYPPTDTVLETAGLRPIEETFDADATLHSVSLPNDTPYIPAMFGILSFSLYRYAWYLSSLTVSILTLVYVFVRYRYK
jgi:hypothetical protein